MNGITTNQLNLTESTHTHEKEEEEEEGKYATSLNINDVNDFSEFITRREWKLDGYFWTFERCATVFKHKNVVYLCASTIVNIPFSKTQLIFFFIRVFCACKCVQNSKRTKHKQEKRNFYMQPSAEQKSMLMRRCANIVQFFIGQRLPLIKVYLAD